jgi:hypothetical protein
LQLTRDEVGPVALMRRDVIDHVRCGHDGSYPPLASALPGGSENGYDLRQLARQR